MKSFVSLGLITSSSSCAGGKKAGQLHLHQVGEWIPMSHLVSQHVALHRNLLLLGNFLHGHVLQALLLQRVDDVPFHFTFFNYRLIIHWKTFPVKSVLELLESILQILSGWAPTPEKLFNKPCGGRYAPRIA
jgi:hypothetical protein